jgi:hypothetical protein
MKNWRTTVVGAISAVALIVVPMLNGTFDWKDILFAALAALFGYLAKDAGVTGTAV